MFTRKALNEHISSFLASLSQMNLHVRRVILFGSYAKGNPRPESDIDLAIWADEFDGSSLSDAEKYVSALRLHPQISVHPFKTGDGASEDPFLEEVLSTGIEWNFLTGTDSLIPVR